jgi:hypothetical protein
MSKSDEQSLPNAFPEKWAKILKDLPEFKDTADAANVEDLKKIIITSEGNIFTIEGAQGADVKLSGAKELVKEMSGPYKDALKVQMAKIKYALFCLEGKGTELGDKESE